MISVAMCTYNGEQFLKEQLVSILNQTVPPDEIIICDDQSKDNTVQVAKSVLANWNGKWRVIENEWNLGFRKNFEKAIQLCHGDIIFLSDQDDVWFPDKIEKMIKVFEEFPDVVLAFHDAELVDEELREIAPSFWYILDFMPERFWRGDYRQLLGANIVQGSACAFRRELVGRACPFPEAAVHDEWLALAALSLGVVYPVSSVLLKYRQWGNNEIGSGEVSTRRKLKKWVLAVQLNAEKHMKCLWQKYEVNRIWKYRYGDLIWNRWPELKRYSEFMYYRYIAVKNRQILGVRLLREYWEVFGNRKRGMIELGKDISTILFR